MIHTFEMIETRLVRRVYTVRAETIEEAREKASIGDTDAETGELYEVSDRSILDYLGVTEDDFDTDQAISEGWGIFESVERGWHIEKDDESTIFATDEDAINHVHAMATMGSKYHADALAWIADNNIVVQER